MSTSRSYVTLDGLRGVAALSIVVLHAHRFFGDKSWSSGAMAVDLFFVLSGFVLAFAYEDRFRRGMTPWAFVRARVIRLYPLYILGTLLGLVAAVLALRFHRGAQEWTVPEFWTSLPFALAMLPAPGAPVIYPFNGPMWSIFFELLINIVWVLIWRPLQSTRVLLALIVASGVGFAISVTWFGTLTHLGPTWPTFIGAFCRVSYSFFVGTLFYRFHKAGRLPKVPPVVLLIALPCVLFLPLSPLVQLLVALFVLPWFVLLGSQAEPDGAIGSLSHSLGAASYAVYVVHQRLYLLIYAFTIQLFHVDLGRFIPLPGLVFLPLLLGGCLLLNRYYDEPARKWLSARWRTPIAREPVTQAP